MAKRSRRLRKKLYLDEFTVFGFELSLKFAHADNEQAVDKFLDDLIEFVESHDMCIGGGIEGFFVQKEGRYDSVTQEDIAAFTGWLNARSDVSNVVASAPINAYYPDS